MHRRFIEAVVRHHVLVLLLASLISFAAAYQASHVSFDASIEIWFLEDDPEILTYRRFGETFGADEFMVVGLFAEDVLKPAPMRALERLTRQIQGLDQVARVESLFTARSLQSKDEDLVIEPLLPAEWTEADLPAARARALADPLLRGSLLGDGARATALLVFIDPETSTSFEGKARFVAELEAVAQAEAAPGLEIVVGGSPAIGAGVQKHSKRDFTQLGVLAVLLIMVATRLLFGRWATMILPVSVVAIALVLVLALMVALGLKVNLVSQSITAVLFTVGVADAVHVLSELRLELAKGRALRAAVVESCTTLITPCFYTSLTTALGMLSLQTSQLRPIAEAGALAALGVGFAFLCTFTVLPALLVTWPSTCPTRAGDQDRLARLLRYAGAPTARRARAIVYGSIGLVGLALLLLPEIVVGANALTYFKASDPIRTSIERIDRELGGSTSMEVLVDAPGGGLRQREALVRLEAFETWLESLPAIESVLSPGDVLKRVNLALAGEDTLPSTSAAVAQAYLLVEDEPLLAQLTQADGSLGRISARVSMTRAKELVAYVPELERRLEAEFSGEALRLEATGFVKLMSEMEQYIVSSQISSFSVAFILVALVMFAVLRSLKLGLISLVPNLAPVVLGLGLMSLLQIPLDPGTVMVASISLGLVVDDTVHLMTRVREKLGRGASLPEAFAQAVPEVGRAVISTSVILCAGFGVLTFGSFRPNMFLGGVTAMVVVLAVLADLFLLPALFSVRARTPAP